MERGSRSPFGKLLRESRQRRGLSQAALADRISRRAATDPEFAKLGGISEKTISNLEASIPDPAKYVRPRPHTVRVLLGGLNIPAGSDEETAFLDAAEATRERSAAAPQPKEEAPGDSGIFVLEGRQRHYDRLLEAWKRARGGRPQVIFLAGDAGLGKTRMVTRLCHDIRAETPEVVIGWGECTSGAASVEPYLPFRQALNQIVDPSRNQGPASRWSDADLDILLSSAHKLASVLIDESGIRNRFAEENISLQAELERVLGSRSATDTIGRFDQLVDLLDAWSSSWPLVLVLEDLHWTGQQSAALLLHLQRNLQRRSNIPILIIGTYRPSDLVTSDPHHRHPLQPVLNEVGRQVDDAIIDLSTSIGADAGRSFIRGLVGHLDVAPADRSELSDLLYQRTEGHPLFATELLGWLQDSGVLKQESNASWRLDKQNLEFVVPGKVRAIVAERIDRLPHDVRSILEVASVQGSRVNLDILARITGRTEDEIEEVLDLHLVNRYRLLQQGPTLVVANRRHYLYTFRHSVFQEHLYEALSPRRRESLHRQTAHAAIEVLGDPDEFGAGEIAFHFSRAHMPHEAATYAYRAATAALRVLDYDLALIWLERTENYALEAGNHLQIWEARSGRVAVYRGTGTFEKATSLATEVINEAREHGYKSLEAEGHDLFAHICFDRSELPEAADHLEHAIRLYREMDRHAEASGSESMLSHVWYRLGAYDDARLHARRSWKNAQLAGNDPFAAEALLAAGNCESDLGMYDTAIETYRRARRIYARCGELRGEILTALNTGLCKIQVGDWQEAVTILVDVSRTVDSLRTRRLHAISRLYLGFAYEMGECYEEAKRAYAESLEIRRGLDLVPDACDNHAGLLRVALATDDLTAAREHLTALTDWLATRDTDGIEEPVRVYLSMALAFEALGDDASARTYFDRGHTLLLERASHISDEEARDSYLTNVPANRDLLAAYTERQARA